MSERAGLKGKTALVTGGALRIGREICRELAGAGVNVVVHCHASAEAASDLVGELRDVGVKSCVLRCDLRDSDGCARLIERARELTGRLDILVNSAAIFHKDSLFTLDATKMREEMSVNLEAPILLIQAFARQCECGKIVNLLDRRIAGDDVSCVPYLLSKKALANLTHLAAIELAPNFTVNGVAPGEILPPDKSRTSYVKDIAPPALMNCVCTPKDVARAVLFLLSADAVTGQILFVDAGAHLLRNV